MAAHDRIRLNGLLRKAPLGGAFLFLGAAVACTRRVGRPDRGAKHIACECRQCPARAAPAGAGGVAAALARPVVADARHARPRCPSRAARARPPRARLARADRALAVPRQRDLPAALVDAARRSTHAAAALVARPRALQPVGIGWLAWDAATRERRCAMPDRRGASVERRRARGRLRRRCRARLGAIDRVSAALTLTALRARRFAPPRRRRARSRRRRSWPRCARGRSTSG